jgi:hypothetical protein
MQKEILGSDTIFREKSSSTPVLEKIQMKFFEIDETFEIDLSSSRR